MGAAEERLKKSFGNYCNMKMRLVIMACLHLILIYGIAFEARGHTGSGSSRYYLLCFLTTSNAPPVGLLFVLFGMVGLAGSGGLG